MFIKTSVLHSIIVKNRCANIIVFIILCSAILTMSFEVDAASSKTGYIKSLRTWSAPDNIRVVFDTSRDLKHRLFVLHNPERVVIDFYNTKLDKPLDKLDFSGSLIKRIRSSAKGNRQFRVVFDMNVNVQPKSFTLAPNSKYGHRLVVDLFEKKKNAKNRTVKSISSSGKLNRLRDVVIAIDAGHGGEDPGALGHQGTYEKEVVLSIARRLEKMIAKERGMRPVMIRNSDYFVSLNARKKIARKNKADMFISIHADSFRKTSASGVSVFALSSRGASSEAARILAKKENATDIIGGVDFDNKDSLLTSVLLDLTQTGTIETSLSLGNKVLSELKKIGSVHKPKVERARFVVLQSLGIPSILVETGFISNRTEERKLKNWRYQQSIARSILKGIKNYFVDQSPPNTFFAKRDKNIEDYSVNYTIKRGDTLSDIASSYNVTMNNIRSFNDLVNDNLNIGQIIRIPR